MKYRLDDYFFWYPVRNVMTMQITAAHAQNRWCFMMQSSILGVIQPVQEPPVNIP